jgi:hypothetical protein
VPTPQNIITYWRVLIMKAVLNDSVNELSATFVVLLSCAYTFDETYLTVYE